MVNTIDDFPDLSYSDNDFVIEQLYNGELQKYYIGKYYCYGIITSLKIARKGVLIL